MLHDYHTHERRKHPRVAIQGCTFAADLKIGVIIDISLGGLAFYYADHKPWLRAVPPKGTVQCKENGFLIRNMPIKTVSDQPLANNFKEGAITLHRRSVRFEQLTSAQHAMLAQLIATAADN